MASAETKRCFSCSEMIPEGDRYIEFTTKKRKSKFQCHRCHAWDAYRAFAERGVLSTVLVREAQKARLQYRDGKPWLRAILADDQYQRILAGFQMLESCVKEFEKFRWYEGGLQKLMERSHSWPSHIGRIGAIEVRCVLICAQCLIRLVDNDSAERQNISLITDVFPVAWSHHLTLDTDMFPAALSRLERGQEDMGQMQIQGLTCTVETGSKLLTQATKSWPKLIPAAVPEL